MTQRASGHPPAPHLLQVDLIKAAAIVAVIVMHSMTTKALEQPWGAFHVWQAVPIFIVLLGMNAAQSARRRAPDGFALAEYFRSRARRLMSVWIVVAATIVGGLTTRRADFRWFDLTGWLPLNGPGNYFIVIVVEFTLAFPLLWWLWRRSPVGTMVGLFLLELAWHLSFQAAGVLEGAGTGDWWFFYTSSLPHWIGGVALGMWLAENPDIGARRNFWILVAAIPSIAYLAVFSATSSETTILPDQQNVIAWPYAALLVMAGIKWLPAYGGTVVRGVATIGRASLQIFLVQMLWFGQAPHYLWLARAFGPPWERTVVPALVVSLSLGTAWWFLETTPHPIRRVRLLVESWRANAAFRRA